MSYQEIKKSTEAYNRAIQNPEGSFDTINRAGFPDIRVFTIMFNSDARRSGSFEAIEFREDNKENTREDLRTIFYSSPYLSDDQCGLVMIPEVGTNIIAVKPNGSSKFFYMGSILDMSAEAYNYTTDAKDSMLQKQQFLPFGDKQYSYRGVPQQYGITTPKGNAVILSDRNNSEGWDVGVKLESMSGQQLRLNSSPNIDCSELRNEHHDYFRITGKSSKGYSPIRGMEGNVQGSIDLATRNGDATVSVEQGGQTLGIINKGNGAVRVTEDHEDESPGMVNVESWYKDINVFANRGNIFIEAQKKDSDSTSVIVEIMSNGKIGIHAASSIDIKCTDPTGVIHIESPSSIDIKSGGTLNLESSGNMNFRCSGTMSLRSLGDMNLKSSGNLKEKAGDTVYINGSPNVHLNDGTTDGAPDNASTATSAADRVKSFYERISE